MHFDKKAASEDQREKDVLERDLTLLSIALHKYLASNQEELDIIVRRWDRQGQGKLIERIQGRDEDTTANGLGSNTITRKSTHSSRKSIKTRQVFLRRRS